MKLLAPTPSENIDKLIVVLWWVCPFAIVVWASQRFSKRAYALGSKYKPAIFFALTSLAMILLIVAIFTKRDSFGFYHGITIADLAFGLAVCALIYFGMWSAKDSVSKISLAITIMCIEIFALPTYFQWPGNIADSFSFPFTSDEISATSIGHFPYSNFIPQYTSLLGYPVAPFLNLWKSHAPLIITLYLTFLQLVCVGIIILLPALIGGWRMIAPATIVAVFPPLILMRVADRPITYFAGLPIRLVLPVILILMTFLWIRSDRLLDRVGKRMVIGLGAIGGATVLNNLDYGIPAFGAVALTLVLVQGKNRHRIQMFTCFGGGAFSTFSLYYLVGIFSGKPIHWGYLLTFGKLFGVDNFLAMPIQPFGLHVAYASLFVATTAIGISLLIRSSGVNNFARKEGALLTLTGSFSLLSLAYFSSRSLVPTLISGYSFQIGMCVAALLPLIRFSARALRMKITRFRNYSLVTSLFTVLAIAPCAATVLLIGNPAESIHHLVGGKTQLEYSDLATLKVELQSAIASDNFTQYQPALSAGQVWQILTFPSLIQLQTGIPSTSLTSSPTYLLLQDPIFRNLQCSALETSQKIKYLLLDKVVAEALKANVYCSNLFDFPGKSLATMPYDIVMLTRKG
jgi:hypothetical protein